MGGPGLDAAEAENRNLDMNAFNEAAKTAARKIYYILTMTLRGPHLGILKSTPQQNGYLSWRTLFARYEGSSAGRQHSLLSRILEPKTFREHPLEWEDDLTSWELDVSRWETASTELLSENMKSQIILDLAPSTIKVSLAVANYTTYAALRSAILSYMGVARYWDGGASSAMEVDYIGRGKGEKGKDGKKGKGKTRNDSQQKAGDKDS